MASASAHQPNPPHFSMIKPLCQTPVNSRLFLLAALFLLLPLLVLGDSEVKVAVESQQVYQNEAFQFQVIISSKTEADAPPTFPPTKDFLVEPLAPRHNQSTSISVVNGRMNRVSVNETIYPFHLTATRVGTLQIPPLAVRVGGKVHRTQAVPIRVAKAEPLDDMRLEMHLSAQECYVGQPVMVTWNWYLGRQVFDYRFQLPLLAEKQFTFPVYTPEIDPARQRDYRAIPLPDDQQLIGRIEQANQQGIQTTRLTFTVPMIPQTAGTFTLPASFVTFTVPAKNTPQRQSPLSSFFDRPRTRSFMASTTTATLLVKELPIDSQPERFSGIIGACQIEVDASPRQVAVGDPIILTLRVSGPPFLDVVRIPPLSEYPELTADFRLSGEEPGVIEQQHKSYQYTLRATHADITSIPSIHIPFFDPIRGEYAEAASQPIALQVEEVRTVTAHDAQGLPSTPNNAAGSELKTTAEGIAHNYSGERLLRDERAGIATWSNTPWKISFLLMWPGIYLLSLSMSTWKKRKLANPEALAAQNATRKCLTKLKKLPANDINCPELALTAINDFLAAKLHRPPAAAQSFREVELPLLEAGVDNDTLNRLESLLADCEACRYAGAKTANTDKLLNEATQIVKEIDKVL